MTLYNDIGFAGFVRVLEGFEVGSTETTNCAQRVDESSNTQHVTFTFLHV